MTVSNASSRVVRAGEVGSIDAAQLPDLKPPDSSHTERAFLRLPWLGNVSQQYRKGITATVKRCYPGVKPFVVFTTRTAFSGRAKDVLPTTSKNNVVYHNTCSCGLTYVGRTSQCLSSRIKQQVPDDLLHRTGTHENIAVKRTDSAITKHSKSSPSCLLTQFRIDFPDEQHF